MGARSPINLIPINFINESFLVTKAAEFRNLTIWGRREGSILSIEFESEIVGTFKLGQDFIKVLEKSGFTFGPGTRPPHNEMIYLSGESKQSGKIFESDCWAWQKTDVNPELTVHFRLWVDENRGGVVCEPQVWGNCRGGACHRLTIDKFIKAVAGYFSESHFLIKMAANVESSPVIRWSEIGLSGISSVALLFEKTLGRNKKVGQLARSDMSPFDPKPEQERTTFKEEDRLFVLGVNQLELVRRWEGQLQEFQNSLAQKYFFSSKDTPTRAR